ncbi:hypothetical protein CspeluHIS016_0400800 [Cutaneotrichosporon spelunceum]|uniref:Uncharacterized protein n=1 Tax=Cutaneotrichosporon spelunceum TaxID=1672016 RepID=A0AAD3YBQ3_9TREE|nr:hypothetical protein CspeluHIS016_0400800 [Cutaneotrichosporon spelunceum]
MGEPVTSATQLTPATSATQSTPAIQPKPWWSRVFKRKRYDPREDRRRVSSVPPRLNLQLNSTPMGSSFNVDFAGVDQKTAPLETPSSPKVKFTTPSKSIPDATPPASDSPSPQPVPVTPTTAIPSASPISPSSPASPRFTHKLHSTTRASVNLTPRTENLAGYAVATYVLAGESAAISGSKSAPGESGSATISEPTVPHEAPIRASDESAFYSTHGEVYPSEPVGHDEAVQSPDPQGVLAVALPQSAREAIQPEVALAAELPEPVVAGAQFPPKEPAKPEVIQIERASTEPARLGASPLRAERSSSLLLKPTPVDYTSDNYASEDDYDYSESYEVQYDYSESPEQYTDKTFGHTRTAVAY